MFHRRAAAFVRNRDWAGMGFELIVVALGVLLGIEASNWNERRLRVADEREVAAQIRHELEATVRESDQRVAEARQMVAALAVARAAVDSGRIADGQTKMFERGMCSTTSWWQPAWRLGTVDQLISSGRLDLIADPELRSDLVAYRDTVSVIRTDIMSLIESAVARQGPLDRYVDYRPVAGMSVTKEADMSQAERHCPTDFAALIADPEARQAVKFIQNQHSGILANQEIVAEEARRLLALAKAGR